MPVDMGECKIRKRKSERALRLTYDFDLERLPLERRLPIPARWQFG
jgi:hypothetical protein